MTAFQKFLIMNLKLSVCPIMQLYHMTTYPIMHCPTVNRSNDSASATATNAIDIECY